MVDFPKRLDRIPEVLGGKSPTVDQLRQLDITELESRLRYSVPKAAQPEIRTKLVAEFGRSTVDELFEDVAKRILERGSVANEEEFRTVEPFVWTNAGYGAQQLGVEEHKRLCSLLENFRSG